LFWNSGKDPDNFAIPYLTAIGDLLGTAFLAVVFHMLYLLGKIKTKVGICNIKFYGMSGDSMIANKIV
jgi:hypothetical protein